MGVVRKDARSQLASSLDDGDGHIHVVVAPDGHIEPVSDQHDTPAEPVEPLGPFLGPESLEEAENEQMIDDLRRRRYGFPYLSDDLHGWTLVGLAAIGLAVVGAVVLRVLVGEKLITWTAYRTVRTDFLLGAWALGGFVILVEEVVERRRTSRAASSAARAPR